MLLMTRPLRIQFENAYETLGVANSKFDFATFDAADVESIRVLLGDGNDHAHVAGNIDLPVLLDGGWRSGDAAGWRWKRRTDWRPWQNEALGSDLHIARP